MQTKRKLKTTVDPPARNSSVMRWGPCCPCAPPPPLCLPCSPLSLPPPEAPPPPPPAPPDDDDPSSALQMALTKFGLSTACASSCCSSWIYRVAQKRANSKQGGREEMNTKRNDEGRHTV